MALVALLVLCVAFAFLVALWASAPATASAQTSGSFLVVRGLVLAAEGYVVNLSEGLQSLHLSGDGLFFGQYNPCISIWASAAPGQVAHPSTVKALLPVCQALVVIAKLSAWGSTQ